MKPLMLFASGTCVTDEFFGPFDHAMLFTSLTTDDLAGRRDLKALLRARFRLHLGHFHLRILECGLRTTRHATLAGRTG